MLPRQLLSAFKKKCKQLLSHRYSGVIIIITVIISRIFQIVYFFNTLSDMTFQILGAQHFLNGHGISLATINASDVSQVNYISLNQWPPGFSLLLAPLYTLLGNDYIAATIVLSIACAILLVISCRAILKILSVPCHLINLSILLTGFFGYGFYTVPCPDLVGISFFITGVYFALILIKNKRAFTLKLIGLTVSLLLCGFNKYLFTPTVFVIPAFLFLKGITDKEITLKKAGAICFSVMFIFFAGFLLLQMTNTGHIGYIREQARGFYLENLNTVYPFITGSFITPETVNKVMKSQPDAGTLIYYCFQVITVIIFVALTFLWVKELLKFRLKKQNIYQDFFILAFAISLAIFLLLIYLSATVGKETMEFGKWTYIQEPRYYGVIIVLVHIGIFAFYNFFNLTRNKLLKLFFSVLIFLMLPETLKGINFTANRISRMGKERYGWLLELDYQKIVEKKINTVRQRDSERAVVLAGSSEWYSLRVSLYSHLPFFDNVAKLRTTEQIKTSKPVTLFVILSEGDVKYFKSFISLENVKNEGAFPGFRFYSFPVNP